MNYLERLEYLISGSRLKKSKDEYQRVRDNISASKNNCNNPNNTFVLELDIPDKNGYRMAEVDVDIINGQVHSMECDCYGGTYYNPCEHMLEAKYYIEEHPEALESSFFDNSFDRLLKLFDNSPKKISQKVMRMEVGIKVHQAYYGVSYEIDLKIGDTKLYSLNNKFKNFIDSYVKKKKYNFGTQFTYDKTYKFNEEDEKIMEYFCNKYERSSYVTENELRSISSRDLPYILSLFKDRSFTISFNDRMTLLFDHIYEDLDLGFIIEKSNDNKVIVRTDAEQFITFDPTGEYLIKNRKMYHIPYEKRKILNAFIYNTGFHPIKFDEDKLPQFISNILPKIKKISTDILPDESLKEKIDLSKPLNRIYFDFKKGVLVATPKAVYHDEEINIFEKTKNIARDYDAEQEISNYLENNDFILDKLKKRYIMEDVDKQGLFLEEYIKQQPDNFEFMVSEDLKRVNILKTPSISSGISLGTDEWLRYDFKVDGIDEKDIIDILNSINYKKKYVKLKNGDIIKLDNTSDFEDLENFLDDLDIDYKKLDSLQLKIPKYKALYLQNRVEKENYIDVDDNFKDFIKNFNKYKNSEIKKIDDSDKELREYQVTGVNFLTQLAKCGFGGILADEMGLGKTFQAITYIKHSAIEDESRKYLIVAPTSLLYNWKAEFEKFAPNIRVEIINMLPNIRHEKLNNLGNIQVVITSYGLIRQDIDEYRSILFDTCIIDEAQTIKNVNAGVTKSLKLLNAKNRFALTGTPIENSLTELYSIFDFLMPGYFSTINRFNEKYLKPIIKDGNKEALNNLNMMVRPFILRRKKKDVIHDLPDKIDKKIMIELDDEAKKVYLSYLKLAKKEFEETIKDGGFEKNQIKILAILTRLRQICINPSLFIEDYKGVSSKMETVLDLIKSAKEEGHKILLFSSFKTALQIFGNILKQEGINYYYIDGQTKSKERLQYVNKFNEDETPVFLISLKAGGVGLNLTGADIVIHLDFWWNPAVENQATDRAHRIGQKKVVEVIKVVCQGTIEERVLELQEKKKQISNSVLETEDIDKAVLSKLTEKDIRGLLGM